MRSVQRFKGLSMSELYDSIPTPQRKAYEAHAAEVAQEAADPVMQEIGHLAAQGAQDVIDEATRLTVIAGVIDSINREKPIDTQRLLHDMPKRRFPFKKK